MIVFVNCEKQDRDCALDTPRKPTHEALQGIKLTGLTSHIHGNEVRCFASFPVLRFPGHGRGPTRSGNNAAHDDS
jgi:hypothetical protein